METEDETDNLKRLIESKRVHLHRKLEVKNITEVLKLSQELDELINMYNKIELTKK